MSEIKKKTFREWLSSLDEDDYKWYFAMYSGRMKLAYEEEYLRDFEREYKFEL